MLFKVVQFISCKGMAQLYKNDVCPPMLPIKENLSYVADGLEAHKLDVIYPAGEQPRYPVILNIHGGAFAMHSKDMLYRNYGLRLAGDVFAVVNINYRLSPQNIYPAQVEDVLSAIDFVVGHADELKLDVDNLFLAGDSAGAYLAAMAACILSSEALRERYGYHTAVICRAVAANSGLYDFKTLMGRDVSFPMKRKMIELLFGRADFERSEHGPYASVLSHVSSQFPPTYLMDTEVQSFDKEALRLAKALEKHGVAYQLRIFEKREKLAHLFHIICKYPQSKMVLDEMFTFFHAHMK